MCTILLVIVEDMELDVVAISVEECGSGEIGVKLIDKRLKKSIELARDSVRPLIALPFGSQIQRTQIGYAPKKRYIHD